jgi:hypothetical protein
MMAAGIVEVEKGWNDFVGVTGCGWEVETKSKDRNKL